METVTAMDKWTPETIEALQVYLNRVSELLQEQGEDAEEITGQLREHIVKETEEIAGEVVTLEHLRRVLAGVGSPQDIAGIEEGAPVTRGNGNGAGAVPIVSPGRPIIIYKKSHWTPLKVFLLIMSVFLVPIAAVMAFVLVPLVAYQRASFEKTSQVAGAHRVIEELRRVAELQERFRSERIHDTDGDGEGDYGTFTQLEEFGRARPDLYSPTRSYGVYMFNVTVTRLSSDPKGPGFECRATPVEPIYGAMPEYIVDEIGEIRMLGKASSEPSAVIKRGQERPPQTSLEPDDRESVFIQ